MESQSPETAAPAETAEAFPTMELFRAAPSVGRPPSSTLTSGQPASSTSAGPSPSPEDSSISPDPSSSTGPHLDAPAPGPAASPDGSSPSEPAAPSSLRETIAGAITSATTVAHHTLTDDIGRAHQLYLATHEEVAMVAEGASSIIGRRLGPAAVSSEVVDLVQIVMAAASYATRTFQSWKAARVARAQVHAQAQQPGTAV